MNQYGRVETAYDQGSFDFSITGTDGQLTFFPTKSSVNDYEITTVDYNLLTLHLRWNTWNNK